MKFIDAAYEILKPKNPGEAGIELRYPNNAANLRWANLEMALLSEAVLGGVNLGRADLQGTNLEMANLRGASLKNAKYDAETAWPEGFDPAKAGAVKV